MGFQSISEAIAIVGERHEDLRREVAGLSGEQSAFREAPDRWTIAEVVEHLAIVQDGMSRITNKLVKEAEAAGATVNPDEPIVGVNTDFIPERKSRWFQAPENVRPSGAVALEDSLDKLANDFERLTALRPRIEAVDLSSVSFPHAAFGPLSGYQWLALLGAHEGRHIEQIREIKQSEGYPG